VFAAPGVGKTTLLGRLAAQVGADHCVLCLVGERGREVEALWSGLAPEARARTVLVAATSDETAAMRAQAVEQALALAGQWRARGRHVLLLLDSATRYAMALREIGLAAGEPPTVRAYTPGVFSALPRLVERCGARRDGGAITAVMTVLSETDDVDDPITEVMKSLLDGHLVLSRRIAEQGRHPAIDVPRSLSRLAGQVMSPAHRDLAARALASMSAYEATRTLIDAGVYVAGSNAETDAAVRQRPALEAFLAQGGETGVPLDETLAALARALEDGR
jgi:flagellum-specific ATP synthase